MKMKFTTRFYYTVFILITSLIIYILTLAPDVMFTDTGELAAVCTTLGVAHPTGYPLFTLLGHLWTLIPLPFTAIYKLNLFAAMLTALSSSVLFNSVYHLLKSKKEQSSSNNLSSRKSINKKSKLIELSERNIHIISFIVALVYSFAQTVWEQALAIEVYSLQLLLLNLILFALIKATITEHNPIRHYMLCSLFIGMGLSNHLLTILIIPAVLFLFFKKPGERFNLNRENFSQLLILIIPLLIGLSLYLYLPLRSASEPILNWGGVSRGLDKFLYHVQGKQYQIWMFSDSSVLKENLTKFFEALPEQFGWLGIIPLLWGMLYSFKKYKTLFWFFIILLLGTLLYSLNYSIPDIKTYFLPAYISLIFIAALGIKSIAERYPKLLPAFFIIPIISLAINYSENDDSNNYLVPEYTNIMLSSLEKDAIIISSQWDYFCSAFWYRHIVEGYRKDVAMIEKELLRRTWYPEQLKRWYPDICKPCLNEMKLYMEDLEKFESELPFDNFRIQQRFISFINCIIDKHYGQRPIYLTFDLKSEPDIGKNYEKVPIGFALRLERDKKNYIVSADKIKLDKFIASLKGRTGHLVDGISQTASLNLAYMGLYCVTTNQDEVAKNVLSKALLLNPSNQYAMQALELLESHRNN